MMKLAPITLSCLALVLLVPADQSEAGLFVKGEHPIIVLSKIVKNNAHYRSYLSYIDDYLHQMLNDSDVDQNRRHIIKLTISLKNFGSKSPLHKKLMSKLQILIELFDRFKKNPEDLCSIEGQNVMQSADLEAKLIKDDFSLHQLKSNSSRGAREESRIVLIVDYYNEKRREICNKYLPKLILTTVDQMNANKLRFLTGSLNEFMDLIYEPLGGYNLSTCSLSVIKSQFTNQESARSLIHGITSLADDASEKLPLISPADLLKWSPSDEREFLQRFASIRNKYLVEPCSYFTREFEGPLTVVNRYRSMYSSYELEASLDLQFEPPQKPNSRRFFRSWAVFNTCKILLDNLPVVTLSMLNELGYNLSSSRLRNEQIYSILK